MNFDQKEENLTWHTTVSGVGGMCWDWWSNSCRITGYLAGDVSNSSSILSLLRSKSLETSQHRTAQRQTSSGGTNSSNTVRDSPRRKARLEFYWDQLNHLHLCLGPLGTARTQGSLSLSHRCKDPLLFFQITLTLLKGIRKPKIKSKSLIISKRFN